MTTPFVYEREGITYRGDGPTLDLTDALPVLMDANRLGYPLYWERAGMTRRLPWRLIDDTIRILTDRLNAPMRFTAGTEPVTVEWDALAPASRSGERPER